MKKLNILIVEDFENLAESMKIFLEVYGHDVVGISPTNAGGLEMVKKHNVDVVVLDGNLLDGANTKFFSGLDELEKNGKYQRPQHILVYSGSTSAIQMAHMYDAEGFDKADSDKLYKRIAEIAA